MEKEAKAIKEFIRKLKGKVFDKVKPMKDISGQWKELAKKEQKLKPTIQLQCPMQRKFLKK